MKLWLSPDFAIDTDDYTKEGLRISILAMSGHGKSNAAADLVENVLDNHAQVIIIEPIPEWHTLKAKYNNIVVIGGPYQDLPLEADFAHDYVKAALEKGISLVVNVSDIEQDADQIKFVSNFLWNLYRLEQKYRRVVFLVLEEADIWAPQMWDQTSKQSLSRVSLIAKHGRKIGIFPILISQRPADLHKSPLSQCNINLFGKFTSPADLDPKTGVMYVAKKLHLPITEQQIMSLSTGSFIISDNKGVHTIAVRKHQCPHGADTPLIEAKPFSADLYNALGNLRDEISKAVAAKKEEESMLKRIEKERDQLKAQVKDLEEKNKIKLSVKEMLTQDTSKHTTSIPEHTNIDKEAIDKLETRIKLLESMKTDLEKQLEKAAQNNKDYSDLQSSLRKVLNIQGIYDQIAKSNELPRANGDQKINLEANLTEITLENKPPKEVTLNTDKPAGKVLFCAVQLHERMLKKDPGTTPIFTSADLQKEASEYGWPIGNRQMGGALMVMIREGQLIQDSNGYRLPSKLKFNTKEIEA
jgi:hypothetical protein